MVLHKENCLWLKMRMPMKSCIVLYLFQIPTDPHTGKRTSHKPQDMNVRTRKIPISKRERERERERESLKQKKW
jgi:hypothetical protein